MQAPGPTLHTARLTLRPMALEDFEGFVSLMSDEESARFIGGVQPRSVVWRGFTGMAGAWAVQGFSMFSVLERSTGRWVGRVGPWRPEGWPGPEVGWSLLRETWGRGYAVEAATAAIDWAFDHLGWTEVIHSITPANVASQQVARRLGSTLRGPGALPAPFEATPIELWGQTREAWRARSAPSGG
ncbi:acetyltransferase [Myxococcus stipitatus DSM 14675]|uniref:Acetyltransferase n=1 Tax=Myxococcus stipitatus (strain DSM 14675 / JCM 12634 / Mx s8) TaxID=1278073 RepID=L7UGH1_MYXSD|nr:GNAT family N-acetyltransferase [Myxococcus stipitatus]AGC48066.1 acetyltransferase [Myxococcus stipitatus DSM 14675]